MQSRLLALTVLASVGFFNYRGLFSLPVQRAMFMLMLIVCAVVAFTGKNSLKLNEIRYPRMAWLILVLCIIGSAFMCPFYHHQTLTQTLVAESTFIAIVLSFFILLKLNPDPDELYKWFVVILFGSAITYVATFLTFPNNMFGFKMGYGDVSRGMLRIFPQLMQLVILMVFWSINNWKLDRKPVYLFFAALAYLLVLLSLTRQYIAIVSVLAFLQLLSNVSWFKKIIIGTAICSVVVAIVVNLTVYKEMKDLTEAQVTDNVDNGKEDVRIGAWRYYAYEGNEDIETWLFGNGAPAVGKSPWGRYMDHFFDETGWLLADVALASVIYQFGIIAAVALMVLLFMAAFKHKPPEKKYLTYFMIAVILQSFASGVFYLYYEFFIVVIGLYLVYRPDTELKTTTAEHALTSSRSGRLRRRFLIDF